MKNLLNVNQVDQRTKEMGLSQAKLAEMLEVSRESVSQWFKNEKFPRPDKLLKLARILNLGFDELVTEISTVNDPVVAFRKKGAHKITSEYIEQARDMGRILSQLVPHLPFDDLAQPATLKAPSVEYAYVQKVTSRIRKEIGVAEGDEVKFQSLIKFFNDLQAVIVPVLWGSKDNHENALHIYLPESMTTWIYLNLDCQLHDFKYWMAHELGHVYAPQLKEEAGENFADTFAGALLVPEELAKKEYAHLRRLANIGKQINRIKEIAHLLVVSPLTVYFEINKFAVHHNLPKIDLETDREIYRANTNFNKEFSSVSEYLFKTNTPTPAQYVASAREVFDSPFFEVFKKYVVENRKSASFVQSLLNIPLPDAHGVYEELC
ncbi:MAG: ImmA/IrrE family metallo-endopeptidase [Desulfuromonadales bacterium]|nr:ImmA/IrrE family metallo-endopeptidase [Desulfuromonadales bacterium]